MELRDYYNKSKERTGQTYWSNIEPTGDNYMLITACFIKNSNNEFLIQKATENKGHKWGSTSGHPISGESSVDGMLREIYEELGLKLKSEDLKFIKTVIGHNKILDLYYIEKNIEISTLFLQDEEVENVKWARKEEIFKLIDENNFEKTHAKLFNDILEMLDKSTGEE